MPSIAFVIPYFGKFPKWIDLTFESIARNKSIDFHFFTDAETPYDLPSNITIHKMSFVDYIRLVNTHLDFSFTPPNAYKLCDLRPLFGTIHKDLLARYDFYGWTDIDILFGDIRAFYTEAILNEYDVLSTHSHNISGHMALFRNTEKNRNKYKKIYKWKEALQNPKFVGIDEHGITNAYLYTFWDKVRFKFGLKIPSTINDRFFNRRKKRMYLVEQYTTPFLPRPWLDGTINSNQPDTWYYIDGRISNTRDQGKNFIYLHLMNFKSSTWRHDGTKAPWEGKTNYIHADPIDMIKGIQIDTNGISRL